MADNNFLKVRAGINLEPTTTAGTEAGSMWIDSGDSNMLKFYDGSTAQVVATSTTSSPTGTVVDYIGTLAPSGWVQLNGRTIGNGSSGATERANADTEALFSLLWDSMADAQAAVSGGRGASAAADYAANKTIALPDARGRAIFGNDTMGNASANRIANQFNGDTQGNSGGVEEHTLSAGESGTSNHGHADTFDTDNQSASHTHSMQSHTHTMGNHYHLQYSNDDATVGLGSTNTPSKQDLNPGTADYAYDIASNNTSASVGRTGGPSTNTSDGPSTGSTGSQSASHNHTITGSVTDHAGATASSAHTNMPPALVLWKIIKL